MLWTLLLSGGLIPGLDQAEDVKAAEVTRPEDANSVLNKTCGALYDVIGNQNRVEIVISGGSSRGSYQAGQMYVLSNCLRHFQGGGKYLDITVAGSSAGSINAIALAADLLTNKTKPFEQSPEDSIFFRTWIPLGFSEEPWTLDSTQHSFKPGETESTRATRAQVKAQQSLINPDVMLNVARGIGEYVERNAQEGRKVRVVLTAARHVPLSDDHGVTKSITETFAFELEGKKVWALQRGETGGKPPKELEPSEGYTAFGRVAKLGRASSAIPVAFPLYEMSCDEFRALAFDANRGCNGDAADASPLFFIDGGALEGNPLRVARDVDSYMSNHQLLNSSSSPPPSLSPTTILPFLYLDPDLRGQSLRATPPADDMWERYLQVLGLKGAPTGFVSTARNQSVSLLLQKELRSDENKNKVLGSLIETQHDPYGNFAGGFLALYDRSFRVWDFYAGLADTASWMDKGVARGPAITTARGASALAALVMDVTNGATPNSIPRDNLDSKVHAIVRTLPFGIEQQASSEALLDWQARQLLDNLIVLSLVYERRSHELWDGSLEGLGNELGDVHTLAGEDIRFRSLDLGGGSFASEFRERVFWQVGQVYKRDALSDSLMVAAGGAMARQALVGRPDTMRWVLTSSPLHYGGLWAGGVGVGGGWGLGASRWRIPYDLTLVVDFPTSPPELSSLHLELGASLDLRLGVELDFGRRWQRVRIMESRMPFSIAAAPTVRGVALFGYAPEGRLPVWIATDPEDPRRYLALGATGTITAFNLLYGDGSVFFSPAAAQTCAGLGGDCRNFALTGEVGVRMPLVWPFSMQQCGRR